MNMRVYFAAAALSVLGSGALANGFPEWCLEAIEKGDIAQATEYAEMVLEGGRDFDRDTAKQAQECVKQSLGKDVVYIPATFDFLTSQEVEERQRRAEALEDARMRGAAALLERREKVFAKLHEGCVEMFRRDQATAITTQACLDHFLNVGLPE